MRSAVPVSALAVGALLLAGCANVGGTADPKNIGPMPSDYRTIVRDRVRAEFFDPYTMQDVWISAPFAARLLFKDGWMVCLRANGKNRMGAYAGRQETGYLINNGTVVAEGDQEQCPQAEYTEWKEMENQGR